MVLPRCERTSSVAQTDGLRNVVKQARSLCSISYVFSVAFKWF